MDCTLIAAPIKKSARCFGALFLTLSGFFMAFNGNAWGAEPDAALNTEIGLSVMRFEYHEYNDAGRILDTEQGGIPGLSLKIGQRFSAWEWESIASYHNGRVDYTGQTNLGAPYNTRTDEKIGDVALRLGRWFGGNHPWMPYGGLGYRRWDRDILPGTLGGLFESYRWNYIWVGAKFVAMHESTAQMILDVGLLRPLAPEMHIDFKGAYGVATVLNPEGKMGARAMLTSNIALSSRTQLVLEPYLEYWELGRSPVVTLGGISVYEPASKTTNFGLNLRLGMMF